MKKKLEKVEPTESPALNRYRTRIITAASLFDGHDAAINIMRRMLQSGGAEVIHLGHNRSVQDIVQAAIQEDASAIAISSYQGGHVEFFKYILDLLGTLKASHIRVFGGGGGTITPLEAKELENYGIKKIYSPEDGLRLGLNGIIQSLLQDAYRHPLSHIDWLSLNQFALNPKALGQALTCIELGEEPFREPEFAGKLRNFSELRETIAQTPKKATVVGITGTGGAGKSSLADELVLRTLARFPKDRIAVLAIDPTRKKTGGALLGDRLRMNSISSSRTFMRSFATREADVSLSEATQDAIQLFQASGFDWVFVETGGIGQADTSMVDLVDIALYVMTSEFGAPTQLEKINMLDFADMVILNKFEKGGSLDALLDIRKQFKRNHKEFEKTALDNLPVFGTIASRFGDIGVNEAFEHLIRIKDSTPKRQELLKKNAPTEVTSFEIVPRDREKYLTHIVRTIRDYKQTVEKTRNQIATVEAIAKCRTLTLPEPMAGELKQLEGIERAKVKPSVWNELEDFETIRKDYQKDTFTYGVRDKSIEVSLTHESLSHSPIRKVVPPHFHSLSETYRFLALENLPGFYPYTAGVFPFKRMEEDPKRQFAGEGPPARTNKRFHLLCEGEKAKRLSTAFDSVTLYGEDPDERPDIFGKIGESGVSVCTLNDMKRLYQGFDLSDPNVSVSMTINGPAPILLAFFFNTAIDQALDRFKTEKGRAPSESEALELKKKTLSRVRGTVQADILKEDQAQNTCIFSTEFAIKMMGDIQQFFIDNQVKNYYSVSISGYHIAEAGANPITQLAFTLSNGFTYAEYYLKRGMKIDDFAPNFSFFFSNGLDPEYTVIGRVARRIWAIAMKECYQANDRSQKLKYHIQTSGRSLHAHEISFNDIRTTLQALLAYFDHCNSLHTNAYDEAVTTPTEESVRRAMAIQLIISKEFGWAKNENPLQGSYFIEELTDLVEEAVLNEFERISTRGGVMGAMETHYQRSKIQEESLYYERLKHEGGLPIVGVNTYLNPKPEDALNAPLNLTRSSYEEKKSQIADLRKFQKDHKAEGEKALVKLQDVARRGDNIFESLLGVSRLCSLGQITRALYAIGGQYRRRV